MTLSSKIERRDVEHVCGLLIRIEGEASDRWERLCEDKACRRLILNRGLPLVVDPIAETVARKFDAGEVSFDEADGAMNDLFFWFMKHHSKTPVMAVVFQAFDRGEFRSTVDAELGVDPVEAYTHPMVKKLVKEWGNP